MTTFWITLAMIRPLLPPVAQLWIDDLPPTYRQSTEYLLNLVGADNFIEHWLQHHADWIRFENDHGPL